jgi:hypothetical protein
VVETFKDQPAAMSGGILLRYRLSGNSHPGSGKEVMLVSTEAAKRRKNLCGKTII